MTAICPCRHFYKQFFPRFQEFRTYSWASDTSIDSGSDCRILLIIITTLEYSMHLLFLDPLHSLFILHETGLYGNSKLNLLFKSSGEIGFGGVATACNHKWSWREAWREREIIRGKVTGLISLTALAVAPSAHLFFLCLHETWNPMASAKEEPSTKQKKSIEKTYQKKTQLEHILLRPDTYVGSVEPTSQVIECSFYNYMIVCINIWSRLRSYWVAWPEKVKFSWFGRFPDNFGVHGTGACKSNGSTAGYVNCRLFGYAHRFSNLFDL